MTTRARVLANALCRLVSFTRMKGECGNSGGFTMIEIIAVIAVIGILGIALIPRANLSGGTAPLAADIIASDIRATQREAMSHETPLSVTFAAGSPAYRYAVDAAGNGEARNLAELGPNTIIARGRTITFNSLGEPAGLTAPAVITVTDGEAAKTIMVEPYTGAAAAQ